MDISVYFNFSAYTYKLKHFEEFISTDVHIHMVHGFIFVYTRTRTIEPESETRVDRVGRQPDLLELGLRLRVKPAPLPRESFPICEGFLI